MMTTDDIFLVVLSIILMTMLGSLGAACFKKATFSSDKRILSLLKNKWIYLGVGLYVSGALFNILALRFFDYSIVLPLSSITYLWTIFFSYHLFHETVNRYKIFAVCCIVGGVILLML